MQNQNKIILKAISLEKIYSIHTPIEFHALKNINISIEAGDVIGIIGKSGSGKTTLLNCLSGIDNPTSGDIYIDNENILKLSDAAKTKYRAKNMGFIFQTFNLIPVLSAVENVELPLLMTGISLNESRSRAIDILKKTGIENKAKNKPSELSGGQKQRVAIARALVNNPKIVWADEPTGNLDTENAHSILDLILELNKNLDTTIIIVTHDSEIAKKTNRIIQMQNGEIV